MAESRICVVFKKQKITTKASHHCCSILDARSEKNPRKYGGVAQLGEHLPCKQGVKGSNPFISTIKRGKRDGLIAQVVRARA